MTHVEFGPHIAAEVSLPGPRPPASEVSVVVVDDVPANVALLQRLIGSMGISAVHGVTDARQAVAACVTHRADLVLLDLQMPHMDGFAVLEQLRAVTPPGEFLPVLVLTADSSQSTRERALAAGAHDFVSKPFERTEVLLRVGNLLRTRDLHLEVQRHNAQLQAELDARSQQEQRAAAERLASTTRIDDAIAAGMPHMVFQPIVDLVSGATIGFEALARFGCTPARPPNEWFEEAEAVGRGTELELAAVAGALQQLPSVPEPSFMSLNVSPATALHPELTRLLTAVPASRVVLELTEHAPVADYGALEVALLPLRRHGVRIALDDTGAGYAGLRHLLRLRPEIIKLDLALTQGVDADPARRALAASLSTFAKEVGALVIAEGIETEAELQTLQRLQISCGQGYHLGRPAELPTGGVS